jgi:glycosyltransferase involved in cell wall biosynthesis
MKFSVVIAVLDAEATLERALASVVGQSCPSWELLVVDGASTDRTLEIIRAHASRLAHWESAPDEGVCHAWNKALAHAKGEWVSFLGADDYLWDSRVLERVAGQLDVLEPDCAVAYGKVQLVGPAGELLAMVGQPWSRAAPLLRDHMSIPHQATFHRASLFRQFGPFDTSFRICGDYELLLRALPARGAHFLDEVVVAMQRGGLSDRPGQSAVMAEEFLRAQHMHGLRRLPPWISFRLWRARGRRALGRFLGEARADAVASAYHALAGRQDRRPG